MWSEMAEDDLRPLECTAYAGGALSVLHPLDVWIIGRRAVVRGHGALLESLHGAGILPFLGL